MREALRLAHISLALGEAPVGAVVVSGSGEIIGTGYNTREAGIDITGHAEIMALRAAAQVTGIWRVNGASIYVTLEPCPMCAAAIIEAQIESVCYGARSPGGAVTSYGFNIFAELNARTKIQGGIFETECAELMREFGLKLNRKKDLNY